MLQAFGLVANNMCSNLLVTGQIGYSLVPMIARGAMLGPDQPVIIHMLDVNSEVLNAVKMELIDSAFPLLRG